MQRQKTQEEIEQESRDEQFARQLQEEMNGQSSEAFPISQTPDTVHVVCPNCQATNNIPRNTSYQAFRCGSCSNVLPQQAPPRGVSLITCQNCRCHNEIPVGATTQFMCGRCHRVLSFNQSQPQPRPDTASAPQANLPQILEGRVKSVQVRCGQCQTINSVKVARGTTEFLCSNCQATNEVDA